jgi:hypothetical protein
MSLLNEKTELAARRNRHDDVHVEASTLAESNSAGKKDSNATAQNLDGTETAASSQRTDQVGNAEPETSNDIPLLSPLIPSDPSMSGDSSSPVSSIVEAKNVIASRTGASSSNPALQLLPRVAQSTDSSGGEAIKQDQPLTK